MYLDKCTTLVIHYLYSMCNYTLMWLKGQTSAICSKDVPLAFMFQLSVSFCCLNYIIFLPSINLQFLALKHLKLPEVSVKIYPNLNCSFLLKSIFVSKFSIAKVLFWKSRNLSLQIANYLCTLFYSHILLLKGVTIILVLINIICMYFERCTYILYTFL